MGWYWIVFALAVLLAAVTWRQLLVESRQREYDLRREGRLEMLDLINDTFDRMP